MIHYTDALTRLIGDIVERVDDLSFIDVSRLLVFARVGRASGAYATCHCLNLPDTEPGYFYWRNRHNGHLTRRTEWFVTKTPEVSIQGKRLSYLLSFSLPRYCDQVLEGSRKAAFYPGKPDWISRLDTVVHELYHIAPNDSGLRKFESDDGRESLGSHGPRFLEDVAGFVYRYLATRPDPRLFEFLRYDFDELTNRHGMVVGTTFRNFPSYPQRYSERCAPQPDGPCTTVVPVRPPSQPARYCEFDLQVRAFARTGSRRVLPSELETAA